MPRLTCAYHGAARWWEDGGRPQRSSARACYRGDVHWGHKAGAAGVLCAFGLFMHLNDLAGFMSTDRAAQDSREQFVATIVEACLRQRVGAPCEYRIEGVTHRGQCQSKSDSPVLRLCLTSEANESASPGSR